MVVADMTVLQMIAPPGTKPLSVFHQDTAVGSSSVASVAAVAAVAMLYKFTTF